VKWLEVNCAIWERWKKRNCKDEISFIITGNNFQRQGTDVSRKLTASYKT
jgi:hypothetical protein